MVSTSKEEKTLLDTSPCGTDLQWARHIQTKAKNCSAKVVKKEMMVLFMRGGITDEQYKIVKIVLSKSLQWNLTAKSIFQALSSASHPSTTTAIPVRKRAREEVEESEESRAAKRQREAAPAPTGTYEEFRAQYPFTRTKRAREEDEEGEESRGAKRQRAASPEPAGTYAEFLTRYPLTTVNKETFESAIFKHEYGWLGKHENGMWYWYDRMLRKEENLRREVRMD